MQKCSWSEMGEGKGVSLKGDLIRGYGGDDNGDLELWCPQPPAVPLPRCRHTFPLIPHPQT